MTSVGEGVEIGNTCALFVGANTNGVGRYGKQHGESWKIKNRTTM